jgi:hypothetical protein
MAAVRAAAIMVAALIVGGVPVCAQTAESSRSAQAAVLEKFVGALRGARYDVAYGLLVASERSYFGDVENYRSVFAADGYVLRAARVLGAQGDARGRVFFVRETIDYVDHATDQTRRLEATVPLGVVRDHGALRIKDPGKPYRAFASASSADAAGLRVTVKKFEFYPDRIEVVLTFANLGDGFVTVLPYNKSVLRDDRGGLYRIVATNNWAITDKRLFEGIPLAPNAEYTGALVFAATRLDGAARVWSLDVAPALRDGSNAPFDVTIPIVARAPAA